MENCDLNPVTIELDEDVAEVVEELARRRGVRVEELIMDALDELFGMYLESPGVA